MAEPLAYLNGRILPISQATLPVFDLGLVMGATVTEMARTFALRPYRLREHVDRLFRSLRATGIAMDHTPETLVDLASELVELNGRLIPPGHDLGVSLFVTAGTSATHTGLASGIPHRKPTVCVHTFPLAFELYAPRLEAGLHLVTTSIRALPADCVDRESNVAAACIGIWPTNRRGSSTARRRRYCPIRTASSPKRRRRISARSSDAES